MWTSSSRPPKTHPLAAHNYCIQGNHRLCISAYTILLDSSYVGFIFLVLTELLLVRLVQSAQVKSLDLEVKRCLLDKGGEVELGFKELGPLKVPRHMDYQRAGILVGAAGGTRPYLGRRRRVGVVRTNGSYLSDAEYHQRGKIVYPGSTPLFLRQST